METLKTLSDEGHNQQTQEYWTTINGKRIYSYSLEALCRTVGYGWIQVKDKSKCFYCGKEWYILSEPCSCLYTLGNLGQRLEAIRKLTSIMAGQKEEEVKKEVQKPVSPSGIILPNG